LASKRTASKRSIYLVKLALKLPWGHVNEILTEKHRRVISLVLFALFGVHPFRAVRIAAAERFANGRSFCSEKGHFADGQATLEKPSAGLVIFEFFSSLPLFKMVCSPKHRLDAVRVYQIVAKSANLIER
jgi:hypothetical protein